MLHLWASTPLQHNRPLIVTSCRPLLTTFDNGSCIAQMRHAVAGRVLLDSESRRGRLELCVAHDRKNDLLAVYVIAQ